MLLDQAVRESRGTLPPGPGSLLHPAGREVLSRYLMGGRVVFEVNRASDIIATLAFARRNGMKPVILGGGEAWVVAKELARADVPVIINPIEDLPQDFDHVAATLENAARLSRAGVRLVISTADGSNSRLVRQLAGNAVAHGLPWDAALAAITVNPATVFGLASKGRIVQGHSAELVLWSGDPLEVSTLADAVWIGGAAVDLHSRQTELRDRYAVKVKAHQAK
jgi:imidazolonepropionase-like amidohydrolase